MKTISIALIGDSDISRWPPSLYPECSTRNVETSVVNIGQGGAVLSDLLPQLHTLREDYQNTQYTAACDKVNIIIVCAGENDVGSGRSVDGLLDTFRSFLDELFPNTQPQPKHQDPKYYLLFIGPKFEPWLSEDMSSRKQYTKLSNALHRTIRKHPRFDSGRMIFIDCLTMFCTKETSNMPGAVHGGRAIPDEQYFDQDGLHLSEKGYQVWKHTAEEEIVKILAI